METQEAPMGLPSNVAELTQEQYATLVEELLVRRQTAPAAMAAATPQALPTQASHVPTPQPPVSPPQPTPTPLVKPPKPEPFRGGRKIASWLFTLEQYFAVVHIEADLPRMQFAAALLRDAAADWWRGFCIAVEAGTHSPISSWLEFKLRITQHFQPIHEEDFARQQIRTIKQTGSVREYVVKFQNLILQIPTMDERSKVDAFTVGLKVDARRWVKLQDPRTLEQAMTVAERYQTMLMQDRAAMKTYGQLSRGIVDTASPMELGVISKPRQYRDADRKLPADGGRRNTVPTCWNCGEPGHLRRDCKRPSKSHPTKVQRARADAARAEDFDGSSNA